FEEDLREFDYDQPAAEALHASCPPTWIDAVDANIPALKALRQRNERVGDFQKLFVRNRKELNDAIARERRRSRGLEHRLRDLQHRLSDTKRELAAIRNSASWRYTAHFRRLAGFGRKTIKRLR
ncbi:MAG: hypothetical protein KY391_03275, partial [Actinobacteria bacterium]|nr:hypothetical protein [Actinomycetota bacterium]